MKINLKVLIAALLMVAVGVWAFESIRSRSFSGTDLNIAVGHGAVTISNPSDASVPAQLVGIGTRTFSVSSDIEGLSGASMRQGSGGNTTQMLTFMLPQGISTFTVVSNSGVNLVANSPSGLDVTLQPLNETELRTTLIASGVMILIALFYMSHVTNHHLVKRLLGRQTEEAAAAPPMVPAAASVAGGQGAAIRSYGDNRADITDK